MPRIKKQYDLRSCERCQRVFEPKRGWQRYCSEECRLKAFYLRQLTDAPPSVPWWEKPRVTEKKETRQEAQQVLDKLGVKRDESTIEKIIGEDAPSSLDKILDWDKKGD
jgi:NMD protein affecting ribosome stability and mRNA decay